MADFNFYLNRQGVRGSKGEKGDKGFSPNIFVKTETPTEFILTINNEFESFDTPNLIPAEFGNKITELEEKVTQNISDISTNTTNIANILTKDTEQDNIIAQHTANIATNRNSIDNLIALNAQQESDISNLKNKKQDKLIEGENIVLTPNTDGTTTISSTGGGGIGDVTLAGDNEFTGNNTLVGKSYNSEVQKGGTLTFSMKEAPRGDIIGTGSIGLDGVGNLVLNSSGSFSVEGANSLFLGDFGKTDTVYLETKASELGIGSSGAEFRLSSDGKLKVTKDKGVTHHQILTDDKIKAGTNVTVDVDNNTGEVTINASGGSGSTSEIDNYLSGSTTDNTTTISVKNGKALKLDAPTIAVGNNLVNTMDNSEMQLYLKQGDIEAGNNVTIEKTATGVRINSTSVGGATINDNIVSTSSVYSSNKTVSTITESVSDATDALEAKKQDKLIAGSNITLVPNSDGTVTISATASSSAPTNMMTTDTTQTLSGAIVKNIDGGADYSDCGWRVSHNVARDYLTCGYSRNGGMFGLIFNPVRTGLDYYLACTSKYNSKLHIKNFSGGVYFNESIYDKNGKEILGNNIATTSTAGIVKPDGTTITITEDGTISSAGGGAATDEYGIRGDYATHYGIIDNPNGIITYNATNKDIIVNQGLVLKCAGSGTAKTTISSPIAHTLTSTGLITLFYANGELLECGKVDYSETEPTDDGVTSYQAWFNPNKTANPEQQWQFKSNDTGNVFRYVDSATPLANMNISAEGVTSVNYIGYRVMDDDIYARTNADNIFTGNNSFSNGRVYLDEYNETYIGNSSNGSSFLINTTYASNVVINNSDLRTFTFDALTGTLKYRDISDGIRDAINYSFLRNGDIIAGNGITITKNTNGTVTITGSNEWTAHQAMPSTNYTAITLGASGTEYVAPADGYYSLYMRGGVAGQFMFINCLDNNIGSRMVAQGAGALKCTIPVYKGQKVSVTYNLPTDQAQFYFIYSIGSNNGNI